MDPAVQKFLDTWAAKTAAKQISLEATGRAKLAEWNAEQATSDAQREKHAAEAEAQWAIVAEKGSQGEEGKLFADAQAQAEAYVDANPEMFVSFKDFENEDITRLTAVLSKNGRAEEAAKLTMFELATFERQHYGAVVKAQRRGV